MAWVPQRGSNNSVELPAQLPKDDFLLKDLEPLGWIKTQALELPHLSPTDVTTQAKLMADHPEWGSSSICMTASFTPGSVSLSSHSLTVAGFEWGRKNMDNSANPPVSKLHALLIGLTFVAGLQSEYVGACPVASLRPCSGNDSCARGTCVELWNWTHTTVVAQFGIFDDNRHSTSFLG